MTISWSIRALDAARRRIGGSIAEMSLAEIRAGRRRRLPEVPVGGGLLERFGRWLFGTPRPTVAIRRTEVGGAESDLPARLYEPPVSGDGGPLLVYYHGGGWVLGSPRLYDWLCSSLAEDLGAVVVSVDYRKAPEHPAPAAADDAVASLVWIDRHRGTFGTDGPLAVAGDSAGGNLATLAALAARDEDVGLAAQVLIYPGIDLTLSFPSVDVLTDEPILTRTDIEAFRAHYLSGGAEPDDPRISPWFVEDVAGVAPALVQTAEHDPLVDEGDAWARRLADAGVEVRHTRYVDVPHGFVSLPGAAPAARQAVAEMTGFLRGRLGVDGG